MQNIKDQYIDIKRICGQSVKRAWIVIVAVIIGIILGALSYKVYTGITNGEDEYSVSNEFYLTFDFDRFVHAADYFNAYTWNSVLKCDPIVDYVMTLLPADITKEQVLDSVSAEMISDYRVLTVIIKTNDPVLTRVIADAYKEAVPHFAIENDMLFSAKVWSDNEVVPVIKNTRVGNAALLGGIIGLLVSVFMIVFIGILDDHIYTERDWVERYPEIPWLGKKGSDEHKVNSGYLIKEADNVESLRVDEFVFSDEKFEELRARAGVIIALNGTNDSGECIDKMVSTLLKQDVDIKGVEVL